MAVKFLHGSHVPWVVSRPARAPGAPVALPYLSRTGQTIVQRDDEYPEYVAVYWLVSGAGRGREAVRTDGQGVVTINLLRDRFSVGTSGVKASTDNDGELDVSDYLRGRLASGYVRVDHLKDEHGEALGIPPDSLYNGPDRRAWAEWTMRVLNPARLRQLNRELGESEDGRVLKPNWLPTVTGATMRKLQTARKKEPAHVASDRALLKDAKDLLAQIGEDIKTALAPTPEPISEPTKASTASAPPAPSKTDRR